MRVRAKRVMVLAVAVLALSVLAPGEASAADCGFVVGGARWTARVMGRIIIVSERYHVYTFGSAPSCLLARQWALELSWKPDSGGLALAWPDNPRTRGYLIEASVKCIPLSEPRARQCRASPPLGYTCRRAPDPPGFSVGPAYCRKVPEPKGYARFYFFAADSPPGVVS